MIRYSIVALVAMAPSLAHAQLDKTAEAEQLFRDGQRLVKEGRFAEACPLFEGSQRLEPNPSTLMNLADCRERNGQLATAWGLFLQAASALRADARLAATAQSAQRRAETIEPKLSYLIINVPQASRVDGLAITRNGVVVDEATWNRAIPIDGGAYEVAAKVPGREAWSSKVTIAREGDKQSVDVPRLEAVVATPAAAAQTVELTPAPADMSTGSSRRKIAIGVGALAIASIGAAAYFEMSARSAYDEYLYEPEGQSREDLFDRATSQRRIAQGLGAVGVVSVGAAAYLWFTGRPRASDRIAVQPLVAPELGGILVRGGF